MENMDRRWQKPPAEAVNSERLQRESLTYWQDCWRRLKKNKSAILSLIVIFVIVLSAIFIPFFWKHSYEEQDLNFANIPPELRIYELEGNHYIYVSSEYKSIEVTQNGHLIKRSDLVKDDKTNRTYYYDIEGKSLVIDYSIYFKAKMSLIQMEKKLQSGEKIKVSEVPFIQAYFKEKNIPKEEITLKEAKDILDKKIDRYRVTFDGKEMSPTKSVLNKTYIWGSDSLGRDVFIRVVYGARMSLAVGFIAAFINFIVGVLYGGIAGYFGGRVDNIMMRIVDTISSIPMMIYVILIMVVLGPGLKSILIAMGITYWVGMARIVRSQVLSLREQEFILAAILMGVSTRKILTRHLIPNTMGPIMVAITMQIPSAMFTEAFLSFVGLGVSAPKASWGALANDALPGLYTYPYRLFYPALAMSITILALNLFSDGLRDSLDPRLRK